MRSLARALVRLVALVVIGLVGIAVILGRSVPEVPRYRMVDEARPVLIGHNVYRSDGPESFYIDRVTGRMGRFTLPEGQSLHHASLAPWKDEMGEYQAVGFWSRRKGPKENWTLSASALALVNFPSGRVVDRIETDILPSGPPCWSPENEARVVFAGSNGSLYSVRFENEDGKRVEGEERGPAKLSWMVDGIAERQIVLSDPVWPSDIRLGGKMFVSLLDVNEKAGRVTSTMGIWWLELDASGTAIVAAGRVTPTGPDQADRLEMSPVVTTTPEGQLLMAYVTRREREPEFRLHVAPIQFDSETGAPWVEATEGRAICEGLRPEGPTFSADSRWITLILPTRQLVPAVSRFALAEFIRPGDMVPEVVAEAAAPEAPLVARIRRSTQRPTIPARPTPPPAPAG